MTTASIGMSCERSSDITSNVSNSTRVTLKLPTSTSNFVVNSMRVLEVKNDTGGKRTLKMVSSVAASIHIRSGVLRLHITQSLVGKNFKTLRKEDKKRKQAPTRTILQRHVPCACAHACDEITPNNNKYRLVDG